MILDRLTLHDFGVYSGKHTLDLTPKTEKRPIVLIGGLNGEGKTTILDALRLALYGKRAQCSNRNGQAYEDFLDSCINHSNGANDSAGVELHFHRVAGGVKESYAIQRTWVRRKNGVRERLTVLREGEPDRALSDTWDDRVESFLPHEISRLFFFDGERIEGLANDDAAADFLRTAIGALLGLDLVALLRADLKVLCRAQRLAMRSKAERERLLKAEQDIKRIATRKVATTAERDQWQKTLDRKKRAFAEIDDEYRAIGGALYENRNALEGEQLAAREQLRTLRSRCLAIAAGELPMRLLGDLLDGVRQQDEAEYAAELSRAMSVELQSRDSAVLELARSGTSDPKIIAKIDTYLSKDRRQRERKAKKIKEYLRLSQDTREKLRHLLARDLDRNKNEAADVLEQLSVVRERLRIVDEKLKMLPASERISEIIDRRTKAKVELVNAESHVTALNEEIATLTRMIQEQTERINRLLEQDADSKHEKVTARRIVEYADKVTATLDRFQEGFLEKHVDKLAEEIHRCFALLLRKKGLVAAIEIDPKTLHVGLIGHKGQPIAPERLSAGERQLLAVSMVWGLSRASGRPMPAVIDTPLGRLDSTHREHLVRRYFPYASHQVLLLSTDDEIDQQYHKTLRPRVSAEYRVKFDDDSRSSSIEPGYFWEE